ncbi:MAG TPA: FimV/HubP family polar landmark protein, partial [Vicinamibacterales bacterium]|nr:FimV/HubP family polar landmark protein [Vicinamibacterales bacterium]
LERDVQAYMRREIYQATSLEFKDAITTTLGRNPVPADEGEVEAWLGGVQMTIGRPEEGAVRLEKALKTRPDVVAALSRSNYRLRLPGRGAVLATMRAFLNQGDYAAVRGALTPMVHANPADHEAALMLAEALLRLNDPDGARALLGPVLAGGTDPHKDQARALLAQLSEVREHSGTLPPAPVAPPPPVVVKNQGLILQLRGLQPGEQRIQGALQRIECGRNGVVVVIGTPQGATRAAAPSLASIAFVTFRSQTGGAITCGAQAPAPALLTTRLEGTRTIAVALELLPDGYVP